MRQIGLAVQMYANDHGGQFPERLEDLLPAGIDITPEVFVCPSSSDTPATAPTTQQSATRMSSEPGHLSYVYLGKGLTDKAGADVLLAYEPVGHHGDKSHLLFVDGRVEFVPNAKAKSIISQAMLRPTGAFTRP